MRLIDEKKLFRIIDANFNRAKEGLRVCEDVCRFFLDEKDKTRRYKNLRHQLTAVLGSLKIRNIIISRDIEGDVGKAANTSELKRKGVPDIFYANSQRAKESVRVLEEFVKLVNAKKALELKAMRYRIYALEKKIIERF